MGCSNKYSKKAKSYGVAASLSFASFSFKMRRCSSLIFRIFRAVSAASRLTSWTPLMKNLRAVVVGGAMLFEIVAQIKQRSFERAFVA
jgi:hypothetical protein